MIMENDKPTATVLEFKHQVRKEAHFAGSLSPGSRIIIRCRDILGPCCHSCHDYADDGRDPLMTLLNDRLEVVASVCCLKHAEANRRRNRPPVRRSAVLSFQEGECLR